MPKIRQIHVFVLMFALVLTLSGCGGEEAQTAPAAGSDAPAQTAGAGAAPGAAALPADPLAAVTQALQNQQAAGPYRVTTTIDADSDKMEMTAEIIPPDQMHLVTSIDGQPQEMVFIGDKGWMKLGDEWMESPVKASDMFAQIAAMGIDELTATASDMKQAGTETIDGQEALLFTYTLDMNKSTAMPMDVKSAVKLWVSTATGLPIRQEIDGEAMGVQSKSTQVIQYDPNIKIEPPVQQ